MKAKKQVFSQLLQATSSVFRKDNIIIPFVLQDIYPVLKTSFNRFSYVFATLSTFLVYFPYFISKDRFMALHLVVYWRPHTAFYPVGSGIHEGKATREWSWPVTST